MICVCFCCMLGDHPRTCLPDNNVTKVVVIEAQPIKLEMWFIGVDMVPEAILEKVEPMKIVIFCGL